MPTLEAADRAGDARVVLRIDGMHCTRCAGSVDRALRGVDGVEEVSVSFTDGSARVGGGPFDADELVEAVRRAGFDAARAEDESVAEQRSELERSQLRKERSWRRRLLIGLACAVPLHVIHLFGERIGLGHVHETHSPWLWVTVALSALAQVLVGEGFYRSAFRAARGRTTNMDTLIALGSTAAFLLSVASLGMRLADAPAPPPLYFGESAGLLTLISLGHWLEARMTAKAGAALRELLSLQPNDVEVVEHAGAGDGRRVPASDVRPGWLVRVRPGERVGTDGVIVRGRSALDESIVTGESVPIDRAEGDRVTAGSLNTTGVLVVESSVDGRHTTVARIAEIVRNAQASPARIQRLADRISAVFVPAVLAIAACTTVGWMLVLGLDGWAVALIHATTVLVISCPCALGLATPSAVMAGAGAASRRGILVRSAEALERVAGVRSVVFDKTGTLTLGRPRVVSGSDDAVRLAAALAHASTHPLSRAIVHEADRRGLAIPDASGVQERAGHGLRGRLDERSVSVSRGPGTRTTSVVHVDGDEVGRLEFEDEPRPDAPELVRRLRDRGLAIEILSGDQAGAVDRLGDRVGLGPDERRARLAPEDKLRRIAELGATPERGPVAMVGDGINDAAALAEARRTGGIGVAIAGGTDLAIESAGVVIPGESLAKIDELLDVGQRTMRTIRQNLFFAFFYNTAAIPAAAFGLLGTHGPLIAAGAMAASDICVIGNALLLHWSLRRDERVASPAGPASAPPVSTRR